MSITEEFHFDNRGEVVKYPWLRRYFLTSVILLVALLSFGVGRLTGEDRPGVAINLDQELIAEDNGVLEPIGSLGEGSLGLLSVTASSQGSRYYYSHCGNNISEKNLITFASANLAEAAGYTLAKNCSKPAQ